MKSRRRLVWLALALGMSVTSLQAQETPVVEKAVVTTNYSPFRNRGPSVCPPGLMPGTMPGTPGTIPGQIPGQDPGAVPPGMNGANGDQQAAQSDFFTPTMFGDSPPAYRFNPLGGLSAYISKIADNSSVRPMDRVYVGYNYFGNVGVPAGSSGTTSAHVETIGFEKTFGDGNWSIGMKLPFIQIVGNGYNNSQVGDMTVALKYALLKNCDTGNVLVTGLAVTVPTGESTEIPGESSLHPTLLQPFVGLYYNAGDAFIHGFSSVMIPTDGRAPTLWYNDIGVGYWLYRDDSCSRTLSGIAPTFEAHFANPLNHAYVGVEGSKRNVSFADTVHLTMGASFFLRQSASLGLAYCVPVTGPRGFNGEAIVQFNWRY